MRLCWFLGGDFYGFVKNNTNLVLFLFIKYNAMPASDLNGLLTRVVPLDFNNFILNNGDMLLSEAIALQQSVNSLSFDCPKCLGADDSPGGAVPTGVLTLAAPNPAIKVVCDLCNGFLKTDVEYQEDPNNAGSYIVVEVVV